MTEQVAKKTKEEFVKLMQREFTEIESIMENVKELKEQAKASGYDATMLAKLAKFFAESKTDEHAIENLQPKPHRQNIQNRNIQRNNTSGRSGIVYVERERIKSTYRAWRTSWIDQYGKTKHKDFSIKIYGYDEARRLAENLRTQILHDLNTTGGQMYADDYF